MCDQAEFVITVRPVRNIFRFAFVQSIPLHTFATMSSALELYPHLFVQGLDIYRDNIEVVFQCKCGVVQLHIVVHADRIYRYNQDFIVSDAIRKNCTSPRESQQYTLA